MASWMEERDRLVAQTQAFVQQVAAAHPKDSARPPIEQTPFEQAAIETASSQAAMPALSAPADAAPIAVAPAQRVVPVASERSDIQARVAAFRARQARVNDEREAYNETMQAKIRKQLGNEAGNSRL